jgi:surface antigen
MCRLDFSLPAWCLCTALLLTAPALAVSPSFLAPQLGWPGLTRDDLARMHAAAARLYQGQSIGTVERWRSPQSGDAGAVTLVRSFDEKGMPCRTLDYTIRFEAQRDSPDHYLLNWCRIPDGAWKIVELAPPP